MGNGKPGPVPEVAKREHFTELIRAGMTIAEAARRVRVGHRLQMGTSSGDTHRQGHQRSGVRRFGRLQPSL